MKYCPICERTYSDDVAACELDGSILRESQPAPDAFVGKTIRGRYRVIEKLGEGGMATVYLAEQVTIERKAALKILHGQYAGDQEFVKRFRQEARLAASLNHPNLISVYDFDQADDGSLFIAMEYLPGKNIKEVMQAGAIDVPRAVRLAIQIADGLLCAHRSGVIHRDIKPENIMVVGGGNEIKLMDFGIARLRETDAATRLTRAGMIMGTPLYMAPEQIEGSEVTEKTDIYAFGIVLYEMLSGAAPFRAPTPAAILMKHLKEIPVPLRKLRSDVPAAIERIVSRTLEKKPERRPSSMEEIVDSLRAIEAKLPRGQVEKTLLITQPLEVIRQGREEPKRGFGALAGIFRFGAGALFTPGKTSPQKSDGPADESPPATVHDNPPPGGGTTVETMALTQPLDRPAQQKKFSRVWLGAGAALLLLGALFLFTSGDFLAPSGDQTAEIGQTPPKTTVTANTDKGRIVSVAVRSERDEISVGERMRAALSARYGDGKQEDLREGVQWRSSDVTVLTIGAAGEIEARQPGKAEVSARYGGLEALPIIITVRKARPLSLAIAGGKPEINVGARLPLRARAKYSDGTERELKQNVRWESSNPGIAAIGSRGDLEGREEGTATITAYFEGMPSTPFRVAVRAAAKPQQPKTVALPPAAASRSEVLQLMKLARSHRDRGAYTEALAALEKARRLDPTNQDVQEEIAATRRACNAERKLGQAHLAC